ncbi:MAG: 3-deoxy-7-phosphoheptulonate synthase, partial [Candidatus Aenigmatarchaeota archaeon]
VESKEQMEAVAKALEKHGLRLMRGGAYKPRTSPYSFQGLGERGISIMAGACERHGLLSVSEVMSTEDIGEMGRIDVLQIGARNMQNFSLLKSAAKSGKPVLLKRGMSATIKEFMMAAEYLLSGGAEKVMLCERGIRTFETETRNTLDISAIPIIRGKTLLPIIVDPTHAAGRKDILLDLSKAAVAAGANGLMVEVHPKPEKALSDQKQQMDLREFDAYVRGLKGFCKNLGKKLA